MEQLALQARPQRNHYLFSDYYLEHRVPQRPEWRMTDARAHAAVERCRIGLMGEIGWRRHL
jgi:hypothetical protein